MTSVLILSESKTPPQVRAALSSRFGVLAFVLGCSALALLLLGYHPAAEDGGIYAAATALQLHPKLFPAERGFAMAQSGHSLFVPLLTAWARLLHVSLDSVLLLTFSLATTATVAAAHALARQLFATVREQYGAVLLFAVLLGLPVAGTSLYLADPYLTARSVSTPLLLLALTLLLQRRWFACTLCLVLSAAVHPLMALCALPLLATCAAAGSRKSVRGIAACVAMTVLCMAALSVLGPVDVPPARSASHTRLYWFPGHWAWFEWVGALAPPLLLLLLRQRCHAGLSRCGRHVLLPIIVSTMTVVVAACCLVHVNSHSLLLARLQPLRLLHTVYCVFVLLLGGWLAGRRWRYTGLFQWAAVGVAAASLLLMQRSLYSHSGHLELPGAASPNGYVQAFQWARDHTPTDALFALDAEYTRAQGEDAQLFRAVAMRSALPDAAKDGGVASVVTKLAPEWLRASEAQRGLAVLPDAERVRRVRPLGAQWIVLPARSLTAFECPYHNSVAQVCRIPSLAPACRLVSTNGF